MKALINYREQLEDFHHEGLHAIKYLTDKGEALESWQSVLAQNHESKSPVNAETDDMSEKEVRNLLLEETVKSNQKANGELRGLMRDGEEIRGLVASGWGSNVKLRVHRETGEISDAFRVPTEHDVLFAAHYISFLEEQFTNAWLGDESDKHGGKSGVADRLFTSADSN